MGVHNFLSMLFLSISFLQDIYMYTADFRKPFSQAKNTIDYLKANHLDTQPLAFDGYNAGPPLSAYLGRKILYLDFDQYGSFCIWKRALFALSAQIFNGRDFFVQPYQQF